MDMPTKTEWVKRLIINLHSIRGRASSGIEQLVLMDAIETIDEMCKQIDELKEKLRNEK